MFTVIAQEATEWTLGWGPPSRFGVKQEQSGKEEAETLTLMVGPWESAQDEQTKQV